MGKPIRRKSNKQGRGTLPSLKHETALPLGCFASLLSRNPLLSIYISSRRKVAVVSSAWKHPFEPGTRKVVGTMQENGTKTEYAERFRFPEAVRLLWDGTRRAIDGGIDTKDLVSLCDIIVRLADHRLLFTQAECDSPAAESHEVANQLRHYRKLASDLLQWASRPMPEPDWAVIAERMTSVEPAPLV
jgi:hypothetical protein